MFWRRTLPIILIGFLLVSNFLILPKLARQRDAAAAPQETVTAAESSAGEEKDGLAITWETVALSAVAVVAGVLRFRNGKRTREQAWEEYIAQQESGNS